MGDAELVNRGSGTEERGQVRGGIGCWWCWKSLRWDKITGDQTQNSGPRAERWSPWSVLRCRGQEEKGQPTKKPEEMSQ